MLNYGPYTTVKARLQVNVLTTFHVVPSSLGSGPGTGSGAPRSTTLEGAVHFRVGAHNLVQGVKPRNAFGHF